MRAVTIVVALLAGCALLFAGVSSILLARLFFPEDRPALCAPAPCFVQKPPCVETAHILLEHELVKCEEGQRAEAVCDRVAICRCEKEIK